MDSTDMKAKITEITVFGFGNDLPKLTNGMCKNWRKEPSHVSIRFYYKVEEEKYFTDFETGLHTGTSAEPLDDVPDVYASTNSNLGLGCKIETARVKTDITVEEIIAISQAWYSEVFTPQIGKRTGYPYNCRGYVDFIVYHIFDLPRLWTDKKENELQAAYETVVEYLSTN